MTLGDLMLRLQKIVKDNPALRTGQVVLGRDYECQDKIFEFFDIIPKQNLVVLVPSSKWDKPKSER